MKKIILIIVSFFIINVYANEKVEVTLDRCVDGDTAIFIISGEKKKVRFLGIDAPESVKPDSEVEPYGKEASDLTCKILTDASKIFLEYDNLSDKEDKYERVLAWVWADEVLVEKELVSAGYAKVRYNYNKYAYTDLLYKAQDEAKESKNGIWGDDKTTFKVTLKDGDNSEVILIDDGNVLGNHIPSKPCYKFIGWFDDNNELFDENSRIDSDLVLTSRYEIDINIVDILLISVILLTFYYLVNIKRKVNNHGRR